MSELTEYRFSPWRVDGDKRVMTAPSVWKKPLKWNRDAAECGQRARVLVEVDVFEDWDGPILSGGKQPCYLSRDGRASSGLSTRMTMGDLRGKLFDLIDDTPHLDWLLLTKRPENVRRMWPDMNSAAPIFPGMPGPLGQPQPCVVRGCIRPNVWIGTSINDQASADKQGARK